MNEANMTYPGWHFLTSIAAIFLGMASFIIAIVLLGQPIANGRTLFGLYCALFVSSTGTLHCSLVFAPRLSGTTLSGKIPKYLDYAYLVLLSASLTQIYASSPKLLQYFTADDKQLVADVRAAARRELDSCRAYTSGALQSNFAIQYYYDEKYCDKLDSIVSAPDATAFDEVVERLANDQNFMRYVTAYVRTPSTRENPGPNFVEQYSQVPAKIDYVLNLRKLRADRQNHEDPLGWIGVVLLPIGLAIRFTKTSLELFGLLR